MPEATDPVGVLRASTKTKALFFAGLVLLGIMIFGAQWASQTIWSKGTTAASNFAQGAEGQLNSLWS